MESSFLKYPKMSEDSGAVGATAGCGGSANAYVVTEKVHGANFCLLCSFTDCDSVCVSFAKRTGVLGRVDDAEDFYSCRSSGLLRSLAPRAEASLRSLAARLPGDATPVTISIFGELFGGAYPHPDVDAEPGLEPVQIGVWYAPGLHFMAFDVAVDGIDGERRFLDFFDARALCEEAGLLFATPLCQGTLAQCLDFDYEFETTLPTRLSLPPLPPGAAGAARNLAEGVVVRPQKEPLSACRSGGRDSGRGLFKRKIEQFSERRFQNENWRKGKAGGAGATSSLGAEELARMEIIALVTEQRVHNVLSKIGRINIEDKAACRQVLSDMKDDVRDSLEGDDADALRNSLTLQEELDKSCREVIATVLLAHRRHKKVALGTQLGDIT